MFERQIAQLLNRIEEAHDSYHSAVSFGGPSVYFHLKSLEAARVRDQVRFIECAYAMLASWGMHRMGRGGSKMCEFEEFSASLRSVWPSVLSLQTKRPVELGDLEWHQLEGVFRGIRCMASRASLVGNSKVMAHLLPDLVPPVDRQYTLEFLYGHGRIVNGLDLEWRMLREMLENFFYDVIEAPQFKTKATGWLASRDRRKWDTSELKIADNLVIGLVRILGPKKKQ